MIVKLTLGTIFGVVIAASALAGLGLLSFAAWLAHDERDPYVDVDIDGLLEVFDNAADDDDQPIDVDDARAI